MDTKGRLDRKISTLDFWSLPQASVTLTNAAGDKALPDVVVAGLPVNFSVTRVVALFKFRAVENTNAGVNSLSGAQNIQTRLAAGAYVNSIGFVNSQFSLPGSIKEGGDVSIGSLDIKTTVTGNGTYNFQWTQGVAAQNNLVLHDVQTGLRLYFV